MRSVGHFGVRFAVFVACLFAGLSLSNVVFASPTIPGRPTTLASTAASSQISLTWAAPASDGGSPITDYVVEYKLSTDSSWTIFADGVSTSTSATVVGLANSSSYDFRVSAVNAIGQGASGMVASSTPPSGPSTVAYNFTADTAGSSPADTLSENGTFTVGTATGLSGNGLVATGVTTSPANTLLSNFPSATNYSVTWKAVGTANTYRNGFLLRAQPTPYSAFTPGSNTRLGYFFQNSTSTYGAKLYRFDSSGATSLGNWALSPPAVGTPRWFRASVTGSTLLFEYSDNNTSWTTIGSATDTTFTKGVTAYSDGYASTLGVGYVDDVTMSYTTPTPQVSDAPTAATATAGSAQATVAFTVPHSNGGSNITGYTVTSSPGGVTATGANSPIAVTSLTPGTPYTFTVTATNAAGTSTASAASNSVTPTVGQGISITSPAAYQVFQRDTTTNRADIAISGTYTGTPTAIEASWNGGAYQTIVASPAGGTFSGILTSQQAGQGTLTVRFTNLTSTTSTVAYVGVGDIYVIAGQSNFSGRGFNNQVYTSPGSGVKATLYGNDNTWKDLTDPFDSSAGQVDTISNDASAAGSLVPLLASYILADQNVPVAFIPTAQGGTSSAQWLPGTNHKTFTTLFGSMERRIDAAANGHVRAVLWFQGETDASTCVSAATYTANLSAIVDAIAADYSGLKTMVGQIGHDTYAASCVDAIRGVQSALPLNDANALPGAITYDVKLSDEGGDTLHFKSDGDLSVFAQRWNNAIDKYIYGEALNVSPSVNAAGIAYNKVANTIDIPFTTDLSSSTAQSFTNNLSGVSGIPTASAFALSTTGGSPSISGVTLRPDNRTIRLALSGAAATTVSVTYASGNSAVNNAIYAATSGIPAIPFYSLSATVLDVPSAPIALGSTAGDAQVGLSWTAPASNGNSSVTDYVVEYKATADSSWIVFADGASASTTATVTGLTNGTSYDFRVRAANAVGQGAAGAVVTGTPVAPALIGSGLTSNSATSSSVTTAWTTNLAATSRVSYGPSSTSMNLQTAEADTSTRVTSHTVALSGLQPCTTYFYSPYSRGASGQTMAVSAQSFTTQGCEAAVSPTAQSITPISSAIGGSATLTTESGAEVQLTALAGFTPNDVVIQMKRLTTDITPTTGVPDAGLTIASSVVFDLRAIRADTGSLITTFTKPLSFVLTFTDADVAGLDPSTLTVYRYDEPVWTKLSDCRVDIVARTVTCTTSGFSVYALFGRALTPVNVAASKGRGSVVTSQSAKDVGVEPSGDHVAEQSTPSDVVDNSPTPHNSASAVTKKPSTWKLFLFGGVGVLLIVGLTFTLRLRKTT